MTMNLIFAVLAGLVSVLSPCVLPLLPLVFGAAASAHRFGPAGLALGLVASYVGVGLLVATIGFGFDAEVVRQASSAVLIAVGAVLLLPAAQRRISMAAGPLIGRVSERFGAWSPQSLIGQVGVGLLLGAVWSPCVGPTLGAAAMLAMQGRDLASVAATMTAFAVGAAAPLFVLGFAGRQVMVRWRAGLTAAGAFGKRALGISLMAAGAAVLSGLDKRLETVLVDVSPDWLTRLTTSF